MEQLPSLIISLSSYIPSANIAHFLEIIKGIYSISSGGVTQLNISRYCSISYRSVQRFMSLEIPWHKLLIMVLVGHLQGYKGTYLVAIDETVEDKAGKQTAYLGWFYSSKLGKVIRSISIGGLSLIAVGKRESYMVGFEQMKQDSSKTAANKAKRAEKKAADQQKKKDKAAGIVAERKPAGRRLGSKNKVKVKVESESSRILEVLLNRVLPFLAGILIHPSYLVGDGAYGNVTGCLIATEHNLHLISKLHYNSALYYKPVKGSGKRKYGDKIDFEQLGAHKIDEQEEDDCIFTFFQIKEVQTRNIDQLVNVVIIRCYSKTSKKYGFVLLFSTDLTLEGMTLVDYYALRFQIEFNFRAAKQHFGLSDFKSIKPTQVTNAIGLAFFMDNLSSVLIQTTKQKAKLPFLSILDLKACFRAIFFSQRLNNTAVLDITNILEPKNIKILANLGVVNIFNNNNTRTKAA